MLVQAILHKEELIRKQIESSCDNYFMFYYSGSFRTFTFALEDNSFWKIQMVSIDKLKNVIGYMSVNIDRDSRVVDGFGIINFTKKPNLIFARDLMKFLRYLRDVCEASKFDFCAFVGGAPELMYRRFIKRYGGRVVGTYTADTKLLDGKLHNNTLFEIMRQDMKF